MNRRDFLKLIGISGLTLPVLGKMGDNSPPSMPRKAELPKSTGISFDNMGSRGYIVTYPSHWQNWTCTCMGGPCSPEEHLKRHTGPDGQFVT